MIWSFYHSCFPRAYVPTHTDLEGITYDVHIFAAASKSDYGAVAQMRSEDHTGQVHLSFILAHSLVARKHLHSIPCLELVAAQLARVLEWELTLLVPRTNLWSNSTTVLTWLNSKSCRYKVFIEARIAEIQKLTQNCTVGSSVALNRLCKTPSWSLNDDTVHLDDTVQELQGQDSLRDLTGMHQYRQAEVIILQQAQRQFFSEDYNILTANKLVLSRRLDGQRN